MSEALRWPSPYLQPDPKRECSFYANAYVARCLGFADVTAQQITTWREQTSIHEDHYVDRILGVRGHRHWDFKYDDGYRSRFWLGPDNRPFVEHWLARHIAKASVHRIAAMSHAVVALEATDDGVLIMDPIYGHRIEPWDWFLGTGTGTHGCHRFDVIYATDLQRLVLLENTE